MQPFGRVASLILGDRRQRHRTCAIQHRRIVDGGNDNLTVALLLEKAVVPPELAVVA